MSYSGNIKLLFGGMVIHDLPYNSREERGRILEYWKIKHLHFFEKYEVAITPNCIMDTGQLTIKEHSISDNKFSRLRKAAERRDEKEKKSFVRPKAVYDNHRPYDETPDTYFFPAAVNK